MNISPQPNTTTTMNTATPHPLSNLECLSILTDSRLVSPLGDMQKRALLRAVHALARREKQKERNRRAKEARKGAYFTPQEILANPPFAQTPAPLSPDAPPCVPAPETNPATETEAANE